MFLKRSAGPGRCPTQSAKSGRLGYRRITHASSMGPVSCGPALHRNESVALASDHPASSRTATGARGLPWDGRGSGRRPQRHLTVTPSPPAMDCPQHVQVRKSRFAEQPARVAIRTPALRAAARHTALRSPPERAPAPASSRCAASSRGRSVPVRPNRTARRDRACRRSRPRSRPRSARASAHR